MATSFTTHSAGQVIASADINLIQTAVNTLENAGGGAQGANNFPVVPAFSNIARNTASATHGVTAGNPSCFGFVAPVSMTVGHVTCYVTAFNASVSSAWIALYSLDAAGNGTQIAVTASTPSSFNASNGAKTLAFTSTVALTSGASYVVMLDCVGGGPTISASPAVSSVIHTGGIIKPWMSALATAAGAPPSTFTFASLIAANLQVGYFEFAG